jgi:hypothetical protein
LEARIELLENLNTETNNNKEIEFFGGKLVWIAKKYWLNINHVAGDFDDEYVGNVSEHALDHPPCKCDPPSMKASYILQPESNGYPAYGNCPNCGIMGPLRRTCFQCNLFMYRSTTTHFAKIKYMEGLLNNPPLINPTFIAQAFKKMEYEEAHPARIIKKMEKKI